MEVASKYIKMGYPVYRVLGYAGLKKSTYYYRTNKKEISQTSEKRGRKIPGYSFNIHGKKVNDLSIQLFVQQIKSDPAGMFYGYKKVTKELNASYKLVINKDKVYRLMKTMNLLKPKKRHYGKRTSPICKNHIIEKSNQMWEMDIKYAYVAGQRITVYIISVIDVFDRSIVAHETVLSCKGTTAKEVLMRGLYTRNIQDCCDGLIVRTDNGSQFVSGVFENFCLKKNICHERIPVKSPNYNAHIESFHRYFQDECLKGKFFMTFEDLKKAVALYMMIYNNKRIHSSINYKSPNTFYLEDSKFKNQLKVRL